MAFWAMAMFWATVASVLVATAAVILVYLTLREARETTRTAISANDAAEASAKAAQETVRVTRETAERELRPWLTLDASIGGDLAIEQGANNRGLRIHVDVTVRNVGNSAAKNVCVGVMANNVVSLDFSKVVGSYFDEMISRAKADSIMGDLLAPTENMFVPHGTMVLDADLARTAVGNRIAPFVAVIVTYRGVGGGDDVMCTARVYTVVQIVSGRHYIIDLDELPIARSLVSLAGVPDHARAN